jgi:hypothetical protein
LTGQAGSSVAIAALESSVSPGLGSIRLYTHLLDIRDSDGAASMSAVLPTYVDNWIRLGLMEVAYDAYLTSENAYSWVDSRPETIDAREQVSQRRAPTPPEGQEAEVYSLKIVKGHMTPTAFGKSFALAVGMFGSLGERQRPA